MPSRLSREQKDRAILTCRSCGDIKVAKGNFYFSAKRQRYLSTHGEVRYCDVEVYSRTCITCHKKQSIAKRKKKPELYKAINKRSYVKTYYKGKYSKEFLDSKK